MGRGGYDGFRELRAMELSSRFCGETAPRRQPNAPEDIER